jgi:hypothetical protein
LSTASCAPLLPLTSHRRQVKSSAHVATSTRGDPLLLLPLLPLPLPVLPLPLPLP